MKAQLNVQTGNKIEALPLRLNVGIKSRLESAFIELRVGALNSRPLGIAAAELRICQLRFSLASKKET